jgi:hypothetical protein
LDVTAAAPNALNALKQPDKDAKPAQINDIDVVWRINILFAPVLHYIRQPGHNNRLKHNQT